MKKSKIGTVLIILATLVLAGIAIFTALRLYQLRQQPVAPNVPSSIPFAAEPTPTQAPVAACSLSFALSSTVTPTPTGQTPTPTGSSTATPTSTATSTPTGSPNTCNGTCGSNANCQGSYVCSNGFCRNPSCTQNSNCICGGTSVPTPTSPSLPNSGIEWPTIVGAGLGILVVFGSLLLAL